MCKYAYVRSVAPLIFSAVDVGQLVCAQTKTTWKSDMQARGSASLQESRISFSLVWQFCSRLEVSVFSIHDLYNPTSAESSDLLERHSVAGKLLFLFVFMAKMISLSWMQWLLFAGWFQSFMDDICFSFLSFCSSSSILSKTNRHDYQTGTPDSWILPSPAGMYLECVLQSSNLY